MESAANLLVKHFRQVLVRACYDSHIRIRFRADKLIDPRVYFNKVPTQLRKWEKNGGVLITWKNKNQEGPHDAIVFVECPRRLETIVDACKNTRSVGVIYDPPTWRMFEETIQKRHAARPVKIARHMRRLAATLAFVERLPFFTQRALTNLLRSSPAAAPLSSSSPARPEGAARPSGTPR